MYSSECPRASDERTVNRGPEASQVSSASSCVNPRWTNRKRVTNLARILYVKKDYLVASIFEDIGFENICPENLSELQEGVNYLPKTRRGEKYNVSLCYYFI